MTTAILVQVGFMLLLVLGAWALYWVVMGMFLDTYVDIKLTVTTPDKSPRQTPSVGTADHSERLAA